MKQTNNYVYSDKRTFTLRVDEKLFSIVESMAISEDRSINAIFNRLIKEGLENGEQENIT